MPIARRYLHKRRAEPARPSLTRLILEKVTEVGEVLLDNFFPAKYPEARLWRKILGLDASYAFKRPTFAAILSQLKSQGLVAKRVRRGKTLWRLTRRGATILASGKKEDPPTLLDGIKRLVCFDIPELQRAKRRWLREALAGYGYQPLQKSVWIGQTPLPENLFEDLDALDLRGRVHIFRISPGGTLEES